MVYVHKSSGIWNVLIPAWMVLKSRQVHRSWKKSKVLWTLSGPISRDIAIVSLRYPLSRDTFSAIPAIPKQGAIPPLAKALQVGALFDTDISVRYPILQHIARYLCDTPGKQARKHFAILSLKVSCDMKSIAAGPLSVDVRYPMILFQLRRHASPLNGEDFSLN